MRPVGEVSLHTRLHLTFYRLTSLTLSTRMCHHLQPGILAPEVNGTCCYALCRKWAHATLITSLFIPQSCRLCCSLSLSRAAQCSHKEAGEKEKWQTKGIHTAAAQAREVDEMVSTALWDIIRTWARAHFHIPIPGEEGRIIWMNEDGTRGTWDAGLGTK